MVWGTLADIQWSREETEARKRKRHRDRGRGEARKEQARTEETHLEKRTRTDKSDTETETGGEVGTSQSCYEKGHMSNIYLTDSNEDSIADFVKDHEEFYDKTNEYFEDKARKECLFERFANSRKLSVKVCKTSFGWQRKHYGKLM